MKARHVVTTKVVTTWTRNDFGRYYVEMLTTRGVHQMHIIRITFQRIFRPALTAMLITALSLMSASALPGQDANHQTQDRRAETGNQLVGRAGLDAATFSPGPTSGALMGGAAVNGPPVPFP